MGTPRIITGPARSQGSDPERTRGRLRDRGRRLPDVATPAGREARHHDQGRVTHQEVRRRSPPSTTSASRRGPAASPASSGPTAPGRPPPCGSWSGSPRPRPAPPPSAGRRFADLPNPGLEVGVLLDASAQHAGRTGREILTVAQRTMGLPASRVDEILDLVSLTPTEAGRRVRNYSLGMRQRLGIAAALLGEPEVLILDEPANGLDPAGIRWMRDLLRGYADRGGTVLLSSHLLHEIEVIADDLVVIGNGRIVAQGTKAELLASAGTLVRTPDVTDPGAGARPTPALRVRRTMTGRPPGRGRPRRRRPGRARRRRRPDRAARRRGRRPRGDVPRAHRRHPARRSSSMSATTVDGAVEHEAVAYGAPDPRPHPACPGSSPSSCASRSTPGPASG